MYLSFLLCIMGTMISLTSQDMQEDCMSFRPRRRFQQCLACSQCYCRGVMLLSFQEKCSFKDGEAEGEKSGIVSRPGRSRLGIWVPFYIFGVLLAYLIFQKDLWIKREAKAARQDKKENRNWWKKQEGIDLPQTRVTMITISG